MHGSHDNHDMKMMWMMMIACAIPIILISFGGGALSGRSVLFVVLGIAVFAIAHLVMMRRGHGHMEDTGVKPAPTPPDPSNKNSDVHSH